MNATRSAEGGNTAGSAEGGRTTMTDDRTKQWYIVHTYSGFENKVKESLEQRVNA